MGKGTYYIDDGLLKIIDEKVNLGIIKNKSEYVNEAIKFYNAYEMAEKNNDFILKNVDIIMEAKLSKFEHDFSKRAFKLLSNLGIEVGVLTYLLGNALNISEETRNAIRLEVIEDLEDTNSVYKYSK